MTSFLWIIYVLAIGTAKCAETMHSCGDTLTATHGIIQTPNFPNKFPVPITCVWVVDASASAKHNVSIVVYFTQQYVLSGLKFTEYLYYTEDYKVQNQQSSFVWNEDAVTQVSSVQFQSPYLEIKFSMANLHGTHIRSLNRLLDVYGFNITYEVDEVKPYQCSALQCRFLGNCYVKHDFSSYYCECFNGFSGDDCGSGPLCKDENVHFCENGGTCKQIGDAAFTCLCPDGFKGSKCEIFDFINENYDFTKGFEHGRRYKIMSAFDGSVWDVRKQKRKEGTKVLSWAWNAEPHQMWFANREVNGFRLSATHAGHHMALDQVQNNSTLVIWTYHGAVNQVWNAYPITDRPGLFFIKNLGSHRFVRNMGQGAQLECTMMSHDDPCLHWIITQV